MAAPRRRRCSTAPCWYAVDVPAGADPSDGAAVDLFGYHGRAGEAAWLAAGRAVQLVEWGRTHRFCGRCGTPTEPAPGERAMRCPACGLAAFPRLAPAMITLVTRGDDGPDQEALLARGVQWPIPMYSCLAGFVEPGESLEGAVVREVREEVGLTVGDVRYRGSQPWPFPHSLMIGFRARYVSGELVLDATEIAEAAWYRRDDLPMIPPGISIARRLIDEWVAEGDRRSRPRQRLARGPAAGLQLLGEQVEDDLAAHPAVHRRPRAGQLVALGREAVERHVLAEQPQGDEQLLGLDDRAAQVVLGVDQQHRHVDVADVADRRHPGVLARGPRGGSGRARCGRPWRCRSTTPRRSGC